MHPRPTRTSVCCILQLAPHSETSTVTDRALNGFEAAVIADFRFATRDGAHPTLEPNVLLGMLPRWTQTPNFENSKAHLSVTSPGYPPVPSERGKQRYCGFSFYHRDGAHPAQCTFGNAPQMDADAQFRKLKGPPESNRSRLFTRA
eukprot:1181349-Prorocentrum_minimum.AAC.2